MSPNPDQSLRKLNENNSSNSSGFKPKLMLYRALQFVSWSFAGFVGLGLTMMIIEYSGPGSGGASPFGKMTLQDVMVNVLAWATPTLFLLWFVHRSRTRKWFLTN